ncbi:MAG: hypothetical protein E6R03_14775 [Hyphomicrobiaceae bacterium]|nr:MAG: hypothetical protein E6R03_14775 [Hyphomicrobiaceae bacterium]
MRYLLILIPLFLTACTTNLPGTVALPEDPLQLEVQDFVQDWKAANLGDVSRHCSAREIAGTTVHRTVEDDWFDWLGLCPRMENGCSQRSTCAGRTCTTGTVIHSNGAFRIFVSPGENADGHRYTVRHEMAHALSWCSTRSEDHGHHGPVWSSGIIQPSAQ